MCVCVCVCVCKTPSRKLELLLLPPTLHKHLYLDNINLNCYGKILMSITRYILLIMRWIRLKP